MLTAPQSRMARAALRWTLDDLAQRAKVNRRTVARFEGEAGTPNESTVFLIRQAFEAAGVEFLPDGIRLKPGQDAA